MIQPSNVVVRREVFARVARLAGVKGKTLLAMPGYSGKILSAFSDVTYLSGRDGEILWLVGEGLPLHRRSIQVFSLPHFLCRGQSFFVEGHTLRIGQNITVDLGQAAEWNPALLRREEIEPFPKVNAGVRQLLDAFPVAGVNNDPGQLLLMISSMANSRTPEAFPPGSLSNRIHRPMIDLAKVCLTEGIGHVVAGGRELVGLGPGLTPSGDDFLGGLLFAAHWLKTAYPGEFFWEEQPIDDLIEWARNRTHPISLAILEDLALGHGPEPLHDLMVSLLKGGDPCRAMTSIRRLCRVGDATGSYLLAGLLTGMVSANGRLN